MRLNYDHLNMFLPFCTLLFTNIGYKIFKMGGNFEKNYSIFFHTYRQSCTSRRVGSR